MFASHELINIGLVGNTSLAVIQDSHQECDLLIKGGTVIDPSQQLHAVLDVAVKDGKILGIFRDYPESRARRVVSAKDKIVTPGLIDLHVHVFEGAGIGGVNPDLCCLAKGVTTVVDGGSAGYSMIAGFRKYVANTSATRVFALVDLGALGLVVPTKDSMNNLDWVNPQLTAKAARENKPTVVGIKVRLEKKIQGQQDVECLKRALEAAEASHLPLMAHIDNPYSSLPTLLKMMRKGDVYTHYCNNNPNGMLDATGKILPEVLEARARGVLFDVGHGSLHFSFDVAEKCLQQNFLPDTISSDIAISSVYGPVFDFPTTLSKFLLLGMGVDKAIELATAGPARVFDYGLELGTLCPANDADVSILELREGEFTFVDTTGVKRVGRKKLVPLAVIRAGKLFEMGMGN
jgi:dihydroorotase